MDKPILRDLLRETTFKKVWKVLKKLYPESHKTSYTLTWLELLAIKRLPKNKDNMAIQIEKIYDRSEKKYWHSVDGVNDDKSVPSWGLDLTTFRKWLSFYVSEDVLKNYTTEEILAYCLWEMTFNGYSDKTISNECKQLTKLFKETKIKDGIEL